VAHVEHNRSGNTGRRARFLWPLGFDSALDSNLYDRLMVMTFWGSERFREVPAEAHGTEAHAHSSSDEIHAYASHGSHGDEAELLHPWKPRTTKNIMPVQ